MVGWLILSFISFPTSIAFLNILPIANRSTFFPVNTSSHLPSSIGALYSLYFEYASPLGYLIAIGPSYLNANFTIEIPKEKRQGAVDITVSTSFFVPKPFTPFQWAAMKRPADYIASAQVVKNEIRQMKNQKRIHYKWHDAGGTELEGVLARGDRRVARVIEYAYLHGCVFDAWTDYFDYRKWQEAYRACGIDETFYTMRERSTDEILPWDFIDIGVTRAFMEREWKRAVTEGVVTPNCREQCSGCGARCFGTGVCFESGDEVMRE